MSVTPPTFREKTPPVGRTLSAIARAVEAGAAGDLAGRMTAAAAKEIGGGHDRLELARVLARSVRWGVSYVPGELGVQDVQTIERTFARGGGDCTGFTVAFGSLARRVGLRTAAVVVSDEKGEPYHVFSALEAPGSSEWIPADLSGNAPFGAWPRFPESHRLQVVPLQDKGGATLSGIFDTLIMGAVGLASADATSDAIKKKARTEAAITERNARAVEQVATIDAQRQVAEAAIRERTVAAVLAYAKKVTPFVLGLAALALVVKLSRGRR